MTRKLIEQMLNALEYHQLQTRPIHNTELAIEAAREYLAQPECYHEEKVPMLACKKCGSLCGAPAQPEQQPVAYSYDLAAAWAAKEVKLYTQQPKAPELTDEEIESALKRAYRLGQQWWQLADSESWSQQRKSDDVHEQFQELVKQTLAAQRSKE